MLGISDSGYNNAHGRPPSARSIVYVTRGLQETSRGAFPAGVRLTRFPRSAMACRRPLPQTVAGDADSRAELDDLVFDDHKRAGPRQDDVPVSDRVWSKRRVAADAAVMADPAPPGSGSTGLIRPMVATAGTVTVDLQ